MPAITSLEPRHRPFSPGGDETQGCCRRPRFIAPRLPYCAPAVRRRRLGPQFLRETRSPGSPRHPSRQSEATFVHPSRFNRPNAQAFVGKARAGLRRGRPALVVRNRVFVLEEQPAAESSTVVSPAALRERVATEDQWGYVLGRGRTALSRGCQRWPEFPSSRPRVRPLPAWVRKDFRGSLIVESEGSLARALASGTTDTRGAPHRNFPHFATSCR
jgi:hypothetical protein